ncbi:hypothetical protein LWE61_07375 [Sphingobium sufflavum]|uniref:hypothetical protein n=1 Tax=Sphingobium sufflavum TaxID=1129547 RepID=UPI001F3338E6|nr:hypothetical protein [Sphingobium sufflavum]MCE7796381.1 hypothetical protein [Sphingobium sufflavum]
MDHVQDDERTGADTAPTYDIQAYDIQAYDIQGYAGEEVTHAIDADPCADLHGDIDADWADSRDSATLEAPAVRRWRIAEGLLKLREQVNAKAPNRSKTSDGAIGDAAHATRNSDHNPWLVSGGLGIVTAVDITHDPAGGCDAGRLAEALRASRDPRIKYIISNKRIASAAPKGGVPGWTWRAYTGSNPHNKHCHISINPAAAQFDSKAPWQIDAAFGPAPESAGGEADAFAGIEAALKALGALEQDGAREASGDGVPLLVRLTAVRDAAEILLTRYAEAVRAPATDPDDTFEAVRPAFENVRGQYEALFASCTVNPARAGEVAWYRTMLLRGRPRYEEAAAKSGVPWWFIAIIHGMEASFNFQGHLHNGDPLARRTVQVPRGRPPVWNPPSDWISSALDALQIEGFAGIRDWGVARALYSWEAYNGWGYRRAGVGIPSPYLWSFSNHHKKGKFVADGHYDPNAISKQCGTAMMLKALVAKGDVTF